MSENQQYCTFYLGDRYYGLNVLRVQEIIRSQPLTPVPLSHPMIQGLMNLRGHIVTAIDLRRRLELPERDETREPLYVVLQTADGAVSLLVDEIGDVLEVGELRFEQLPDMLEGAARELILGAYKLPDRLLVILDVERIVSVPDRTTDLRTNDR